MKQTIVRRERNVGIKKDIKSATKAFNVKPSSTALSKAHSELDKAVKKGLIKKNTAARRKASLAATAKSVGVKMTSTTPTKKSTVKYQTTKKAATKTPSKKPTAKKQITKK